MAETIVLDPVDGPALTNLIPDPAFAAFSGWAVTATAGLTGVALTQVSSWDQDYGPFAARLVGTQPADTTSRELAVGWAAASGASAIPVVVGTTYMLAARARTLDASISAGFQLVLVWRTAAGAVISSSTATAVTDEGFDGILTFSATAPATAAFVQPRTRLTTTTAGDVLSFDVAAMWLVEGATFTRYFDGDTIGDTPTSTYAWTGAPAASASVRTNHRTELDITPWVSAEGIDWGQSEIDAFMADMDRGSSPVDYRTPNRLPTIPLNVQARGTFTFEAARAAIQSKAARFQQEGGAIKRVTSAGTVFADVVKAGLVLSGSWQQANRSADADASLVLEALPDFYESEIPLPSHVETAATELVFTETGLKGDGPARVRLAIDDDQGQSQLGLIWGFRSRHYSPDASARLAYEAEALQPLDIATKTALAGASGGTVVRHGTLSTDWTPVLSTNIGGTTYLTHTGTYRVWARVYSTSGANQAPSPEVRLLWDVGDWTFPVENAAVEIPGASNFYLVDMGAVRLDPAAVGIHRWQAVVQAKGTDGGENVSIDKLEFAPVDEGYGVLRASANSEQGLAPYLARDPFTTQSAGALTGGTLAVTGATNATPIVITANAHGLVNGDAVWIEKVGGNTAANGYWIVASSTTNTFALTGSVGNGAYTSGGVVSKPGKALIVGAGWHGVGDADDFQIDTVADTLERAAASDANFGRLAFAPGAGDLTNVVVQVDYMVDAYGGAQGGVAGRIGPGSTGPHVHAMIGLTGTSEADTDTLVAIRRWSQPSFSWYTSTRLAGLSLNTWYSIRMMLLASGVAYMWLFEQGAKPGDPVLATNSIDMAAGGLVASGRVGIVDLLASATVANRSYRNFAVWTPSQDAVIQASRTALLTTEGMIRQDSTGSAYGPVGSVTGSLPRLPVAGLEGRTTEVFVRPSRGDLVSLPDSGIDDMSGRVFYRPCYLTVPGS